MVSDGGGVPEMGVLEVGAGLLQPGELAGGRKVVMCSQQGGHLRGAECWTLGGEGKVGTEEYFL